MPDLSLKLDPAHAAALLDARIKERTALIRRNDAIRRATRAERAQGADHADTKKALRDRDDRRAEADAHAAAFAAAKTAAKAAHGAAGTYAEEVFDVGQGVLILREQPEARLVGRPPVERKRVTIPDADCAAYAASYAAQQQASDEAADLMRQIEDYKVAHPALFAGGFGEPPPVDPAYEALKAAYAARQATVQAELARQSQILKKLLAGEAAAGWTYYRTEIATGEIVCGDNPNLGPGA